MATVILNHRVKDYASWKVTYDADKARRESMGIGTELAVGQKAGDPGMAYMIWQMADPSVLSQMMGDPNLQKVMEDAGVIGVPELMIIE